MKGKMGKYIPLLTVVILALAAFLVYTLTDVKYLFTDQQVLVDHVITTEIPQIREIQTDIEMTFDLRSTDMEGNQQSVVLPDGTVVSATAFTTSMRYVNGEVTDGTALQMYLYLTSEVSDGKWRILSPYPFPQDLSDGFYKEYFMDLQILSTVSPRFVPQMDGVKLSVGGTEADAASCYDFLTVTAEPDGKPYVHCAWTLIGEPDRADAFLTGDNPKVTLRIRKLYVMEYDLGFFGKMAMK